MTCKPKITGVSYKSCFQKVLSKIAGLMESSVHRYTLNHFFSQASANFTLGRVRACIAAQLCMVRMRHAWVFSMRVGNDHFFFPTPPIFPFLAVALLLLSGSFRLPVVLCLVVTAPKKDSSRPATSKARHVLLSQSS